MARRLPRTHEDHGGRADPAARRRRPRVAATAKATDNGDWQLLVRVATDEGLTGWADVETLGPAAARIIAGPGHGDPRLHALCASC